MASPFKFFRKYSAGMMIVLVILAMLLFTLDGLFSDTSLNLWLLGMLLGGTVFGIAGIGQGRWLQWGIGGAILGTVLGYVLPDFLAPGGLSTSFGVLEDEEINDMAMRRAVANQFMMQATEASFGEGMAQFAPLFGFGYDGARDVILGRLLREEAKRLGITVDKSMVGEYLKRATSEKLTAEDYVAIRNNLAYQRKAITEEQLQQVLADEIQARMAYQTLTTRTSTLPPGPEVYWQFYRRLNVRQQVFTAALNIDDFTDQVGDPTDAQVEELFNEFNKKLPNEVEPGSPGFRLPLRAQLAYIELDSASVEASLDPVTDAEIEKYYADNKETPLVRREVIPDFPGEGKPADETKTDAESSDKKPEADAEATKTEESQPADADKAADKPADEAKKEAAPEPEKPADEKPADEKKDSEPAAEEANSADDNILEPEDDFNDDEPEAASDDAAKSDDAKSDDAKSDDAKSDDAKSDDAKSDDAKSGDADANSAAAEKPAAPEAAAADKTDATAKADAAAKTDETEKPAAAAPATSLTIPDMPAVPSQADGAAKPEVKYEYRPLDDEMKKLIREEIQQQKVREIVQAKLAAARVQMESMASERSTARFARLEETPDSFSVDNEKQQESFRKLRESLKPLHEDLAGRLKKYAADNGLAFVETPLLSFADLLDSEDFTVGIATEPADNPMFAAQSPTAAVTVFRSFGEEEQGNDAQLFFVRAAQRPKLNGEGQSHYLYWATDFDLSHVPSLDEPGVKDMVTKSWKRLQARDVIKKRGEELAELVRAGLKKEGDDHQDMVAALADATVSGKDGSAALAVRKSLPFSWLKTSAAAPMSFQQPQVQLGQIQFDDAAGGALDKIGAEFMEAIFEGMGNDQVSVVPNYDHSTYYVVQATNRFPTPEVGEDSLREKFASEAQFGFRQSPLLSVMQQEIARPANIEWEKALWQKYGINLDQESEE